MTTTGGTTITSRFDGATADRATAKAGVDPGADPRTSTSPLVVRTVAVGFADLCGFTKLSRALGQRELVDLLDRFEDAALLALPAAGATVVKLLGDGVLFHASSADVAVDAAALLVDEAQSDGHLPPVRAAVCLGPVVLRAGDCFGEVVNRASRMLDVAPPHTVVVDASIADALCRGRGPGAPDGRRLHPLGHPHLRDYGPWPLWTAVS